MRVLTVPLVMMRTGLLHRKVLPPMEVNGQFADQFNILKNIGGFNPDPFLQPLQKDYR